MRGQIVFIQSPGGRLAGSAGVVVRRSARGSALALALGMLGGAVELVALCRARLASLRRD
ncbi:hypothetical protein [Derxia lacustris]|uniref:hypothetical protein n=1 Tax=Derxia lacustris TaxID=764842 RepID=UPI000A17292C|nr:hypothetical protein [Derxia lacustris]